MEIVEAGRQPEPTPTRHVRSQERSHERGRMNIIVRLPNWLGDLVMATPMLRALRGAFPDARITAWAKPGPFQLLEDAPWFDDRFVVGSAGGAIRDGLALRRERYDRAILLPSSWSSAITATLAKIPERFGYAEDQRGVLLSHRLRAPFHGRLRPIPKVDHYLRLAVLAGCDPGRTGLLTELPLTERAQASAADWLREKGLTDDERPIAVSVGASFGPSKMWAAERWSAVIDALQRDGHRVVVYGGPKDKPAVREVLAGCATAGAVEATTIALKDLAAHFARAKLLISTDAGGRHIGVAVGTPTVCIMGPTHPGYSETYAAHDLVLLDRPACWPCHLRVCPTDHRCMTAISTKRVLWAANAMLRGAHPYGGAKPWATPPGREHRLFPGAACS